MTLGAHVLLGALAAGLAGFAQGVGGFGFALVLTPLLLLLTGSATTAVFASVALGVPLSLAVVWETRRHLCRAKLLQVLLGATAATPLGLLLAAWLPARAVRAAAAGVALLGAALFAGPRPRVGPRRRAVAPCWRGWLPLAGIVGGAVNGTTSMGGPPAALLVAAGGADTQEARGMLSALNLLSYALTGAGEILLHRVGAASLRYALESLPAAVLGALAGGRLARRLPSRAYPAVAASIGAVAAVFALADLAGS